MDAREVARAYQARQEALARRIAAEVAKSWRAMDPSALTASWTGLLPRVLALVAGGQALAATAAEPYIAAALDAQDVLDQPDGAIDPRAFAGTASDGRPLLSLLAQPVITVKQLISQGAAVPRALAAGGAQLDMMVRTQVADSGRTAVGAGIAARNGTGYVRMVSAGACSRCVVLAGRFYRWNRGFLRHPRCHCTHIPAAENIAGHVMTSPKAYFNRLTAGEQDRVFTRAGAQAIRDGADISQVVNARRGMFSASVGGRTVAATREGTTVRALFGGYQIDPETGALRRRASGELTRRQSGRRTLGAARAPRLMPEEIYRIAGSDRAEAVRLLQRNGYLTQARPVPAARTFDDRIAAAAASRDALAAAQAAAGRRTAGMLPLTRPEQAAMREYVSSFYYAVNGQLRRGDLGGSAAREIAAIDAVMARAPLGRDVAVWRGITDASRLFGARLAADLTGFEWRELAYTSTSASRAVAQGFTYQSGQVLMRLLVPRGTGAVRLSGMGAGEQAELLLQRGLRLRVFADRGASPEGYRLLDVEVFR